MAIYEYRCEACDHSFEELQGVKDDPLKKCPECGKLKLFRLLGTPALVFKGSGWTPKHYGENPEQNS
jgi:putative FmdB family regulatory protein